MHNKKSKSDTKFCSKVIKLYLWIDFTSKSTMCFEDETKVGL